MTNNKEDDQMNQVTNDLQNLNIRKSNRVRNAPVPIYVPNMDEVIDDFEEDEYDNESQLSESVKSVTDSDIDDSPQSTDDSFVDSDSYNGSMYSEDNLEYAKSGIFVSNDDLDALNIKDEIKAELKRIGMQCELIEGSLILS